MRALPRIVLLLLLALLLLTDARRGARLDSGGDVIPLDEQDRSRWNHAKVAEGTALLDAVLRGGTTTPPRQAAWPGPTLPFPVN